MVTTPNETGPVTGRMWVLEPEVLGSNPSGGTSSYVGCKQVPQSLGEVKVSVPVVANTQVYGSALVTGCHIVVSYCVAFEKSPCSI